jgi:hypothetical protein
MDKKELKQFIKLYEKFESECNRVCSILNGSKKRHGECNNISYAEKFKIEGENSVWWEGDEYWNYGGHEWHSGYFPSDFLTMSDDDLAEIVKKENEEFDREVERKSQEKAEREKAARLAEYEKLKKEFGQ